MKNLIKYAPAAFLALVFFVIDSQQTPDLGRAVDTAFNLSVAALLVLAFLRLLLPARWSLELGLDDGWGGDGDGDGGGGDGGGGGD